MITRKDITPAEYNPYYTVYLESIPAHATIIEALETGLHNSLFFLEHLTTDLSYRYEPSKWSIGQVIQHNIDTERVFAYRALRFVRGDKTALMGFDQDIFAASFNDYAFAKANLIKSLKTTRQATIQLFSEVQDELLARTGTASANVMSARAIPFIIAGHTAHHEQVIRERYLKH